MVWMHIKNEYRGNYKEGFEHEVKRKTPKREIKLKMETTVQEIHHMEGRT
jgi:hypothetical protein